VSIFDNLYKRFFNDTTLKEPEWWRQIGVGLPTTSGVYINPDNALQIGVVYACVRTLSEDVASLPLKIYRKSDDGREVLRDHPLSRLFNVSPNGEQTAFEMREFLMANLALRGNAYCQIIRRGGRVVMLQPLNAKYMHVDRNGAGKLVFDYQEEGNARVYNDSEIWRIAAIGSNGVTGLSPVALARESMGVVKAGEEQSGKMYSNGAQIPGVLEFPQTLSKEQIDHLRKQWADNHQGTANAYKPLILESGMKYSQIGMSANDAQFLESRKFQITDVLRWYRMPPHKVGDLERATHSNIEHQGIEYYTSTLRPWLVRIEQTIMRDLFTLQEQNELTVSHTADALLRGDTKSRFEAYGKGITDGWLNRNEVREMENKNKVDGLDEYLTPLNMATTSEREQELNNSVANMLSEKETKAINVEMQRNSPDEFKDWAEKYYNRFTKVLTDALRIPVSKAKNYADKRIAEIHADPVMAVPYILKHCKKELEELGNE
jgi:HK97 family phage portal protein